MAKAKKDDEKDLEYFQNIVITLSDGRDIKASIPAFAFSGEELGDITIQKVQIFPPRPLPKGSSFENFEG